MPACQFTIQFPNECGELAALLESLAEGGITLRAIGTSRIGQHGVAVLIPNDDGRTREILNTRGYEFVEGEVLVTSAVDETGAIAAIARRLTNAGINVRGLLALGWHQGKVELALSVDDLPAAHKLLGG
jgi:hypothetical protein